MSNVPANLQYSKEHEWVEGTGGNRFKIGITDYAQGALGDIVYVQLPKVGDSVTEGAVCGEIESTKSVSELFSPVTGTVVAINEQLDSAPETLNSDPYGAGWIAEIEVSAPSTSLMDAAGYSALIG
ncbi:MAG: glycine cleavage system protein GcvH [Actinomycetales bacterium]|nr:glycine cleavage system protein GcvH [Actinomycetales bacterium]